MARGRGLRAYLRQKWGLSRAYHLIMIGARGYGGFTGSDRAGYPLDFYHKTRLGDG